MIALALLLQVAAPPPEDVVVVAERLRSVRLAIRRDRKTGERTCRFRKRSGDAEIDAKMCEIALACTTDATRASQVEGCAKPIVAGYMKERAARRAAAYAAGAPSIR